MTTLVLQQQNHKMTSIGRLSALMAQAQNWLNRYHQRQQLAQLDSRLLKDIGIDAEQMQQEVSKPFWR